MQPCTTRNIKTSGPGDPSCPDCHGRGEVQKQDHELSGVELKVTAAQRREFRWGLKPCGCVATARRKLALVTLLDMIWPGLSKVDPAPSTLLRELTARSAWVRASRAILQAHVGRLLTDDPWLAKDLRVLSDADLYDAEWAPKAVRSEDDDQEKQQKARGPRLPPIELYKPPQILILLVGRREQRHKALAELCTDACRRRADWGKVTWIVDDPARPMDKRHPTWSAGLEAEISTWQHLLLPVVSDPGVLAEAWPEVVEAAVKAAEADKPKAAAKPKYTAMSAAVGVAVEELGVLDAKLQEDNGGAEGTCPDCGGPCSIWEGSKDHTAMFQCRGPKCATKGKAMPFKAAQRLLGKQPSASSSGTKSRGGKAHQWLADQLSRGPRPVGMIDQDAKDAGFSTATLYRARGDLAEVVTDADGHKMLRLKVQAPTSDPPDDVEWVPPQVQLPTSHRPKAQVPSGCINPDDLDDAMDSVLG